MIELRPYQADLKKEVYRALKSTKKVLVALPTGGGKTVVMASIVKDMVGRGLHILILVHRDFLIKQTLRTLERASLECIPDYITATSKGSNSQVTVAMVQTLSLNMDIVRNKKIDVVITDEAHHASAATYKRIHKEHPNAFHIGFTATPVRTGGSPLSSIYEELVETVQVTDLVDGGFLVEPDVFVPETDVDLSAIKISKGDYDEREAGLYMSKKEILGHVVGEYKRLAMGKRTCVFACNVDHSINLCAEFNAAGIPAKHIDGATPAGERTRILESYLKGETLALCNVGIFTEGFDLPLIECVQLARPTKSVALYMQMVGRGLRTAEGKDRAIIIDHGLNVKEHGSPLKRRQWDISTTISGMERQAKKKKPKDPAAIKRLTIVESLESHFGKLDLLSERIEDLERLIQLVEKNEWKTQKGNYNYMWAWKKYVQHKPPSMMEIIYFQKRANYKEAWADYAWQEINKEQGERSYNASR
jgi:superfamily II DNA or RNA helicase